MPTGPMANERPALPLVVKCRRCGALTPPREAVFLHLAGYHCPTCAREREDDESTPRPAA